MAWDVPVVYCQAMQCKVLPGTDWGRATLGGINVDKAHVKEVQV